MSGTSDVSFYREKLNIKEIINNEQLAFVDEALNICDLTSVVEKYRTWQRLMPRITPYYAVKCNDDALVVKTLAKLGASFDCASQNEIKQVLDLDVSPNRIIFANPCKPVSHLKYAKENKVHAVTVDNEFEILKISEHYPESDLVIRFRSEAKEAQCPLGDKFGCDAVADATALIMLAKSLNLNVIGTSFHVGSGCHDFPAYDRAIITAKNLFNVGKLVGYDMNLLDIGGGFPGYDDAKFETIAEIVNKSLSENFKNDEIRVIAEPGRFFVAAAYTLICKIHAKREVRTPAGKLDTLIYYLNDGVYSCFNCILYDHQVVTTEHYLDDVNDLPKFKTVLFGPTCDALDKISDETYLPIMKNGDFIGFPNMGAYTVPTASPFNGFKIPKTRYFMKVNTII